MQPYNPGILRSEETVYFGYRCRSESHWKCSFASDNGQEKVIVEFSWTQTQPEQNYCVTRKELWL